MTINLDGIDGDDVCVYVVSDGGYLFICEMCFDEDRTDLNIEIPSWQRVNKIIFSEMYKSVTNILNDMKEDDPPISPSMSKTQKMLNFLPL